VVDRNKTIIYIYINKIRGTQKAKGERHREESDMIGEGMCILISWVPVRIKASLIKLVCGIRR